jgi:aquaporin Z
MAWTSTQKYFAEFVGTFALLFMGGGSAVFTLQFLGGFEPAARVVIVSLVFGFVLMALAYAFGDVSGGHFNPAVTVSMAVNRRLPLKDVVPYLVAQIVGSILGIAVVWGIVSGLGSQYTLAKTYALGSQCYAGNGSPCGYSLGSVFLLELVMTFVFILVIQLVTRPESSAKNLAPLAIGGALMVGNFLAIPVDGASLNPVRSFAPALLSAQFSGSTWAIDQSWLFWVAPILGGILAGLVEMWLRPKE